jgi:hypothetical protein
MNTRIGKIARLPHSIREQLNLKLHDGLPAKSILPWLNSLPETKAILTADFDNRPITKQNLSDWKHGGFRDWLLQFQAANFLLDFSSSSSLPPANLRDGTDQPQNLPSSLTHHESRITDLHNESRLTAKLLLWTQLQYVAMARHIDAETDPDRKWSALRHFANDISRLKRSSLADDYLQIQHDWLALSQSNTADKKEKDFWKWTTRPDIAKKLFPARRRGMTDEELYQFEKDCCLMGDEPGPEIAELMAEVRIAKKLLQARKAQETLAKAKANPNYDPNRPLPDTRVKLAGMPFEELFPTIPDKPLTQTHPELDDDIPENPPTITTPPATQSPEPPSAPSNPACPAEASERRGVQPSQGESSQIQPPSPLDLESNPSHENPPFHKPNS